MRTSEVVATLAVVGTIASFIYLNQGQNPHDAFLTEQVNTVEQKFINHIAEHGRRYATKEEYYYRLGLFTATHDKIENHNARHAEREGFTMGHNQFSDMTEAEFKRFTGYDPSLREYSNVETLEEGLEDISVNAKSEVDWKKDGAVTPIKN